MSPSRVPNNDCQRALLALARAELTAWPGADGCTRADADHVFGDAVAASGRQRTYRATAAGVDRYLQATFAAAADGALELIVIYNADVPAETVASLGPPEARSRSGLGDEHEQWIYASRGLTVHVDVFERRGAVLVAYRRMTAAEFLERPYSWMIVADEEHAEGD